MNHDDPVIVCENLVKIYKVGELEVLALQGLDLVVRRSEMVGIVGASGSGKSTLMNVLGGLLRPSAGRVLVNGSDLLKLSDSSLNKYRREKVGFVWQQGVRNLLPYLNARENVELPAILAGAGRKKAHRRANELLEIMGLSDRKSDVISHLSGGEQQRVAIAVALANQPSILLADEPTGELDKETAQSIYQAFRILNDDLGVTILIVSHDPGIARHVHRVIAIRDGKTASETRWTPASDERGDALLEELVVLDTAGRLQVPKAYRQALDIRDRVRMEVVDDGVLIRPAPADTLIPRVHSRDDESPPKSGLREKFKKLFWRND